MTVSKILYWNHNYLTRWIWTSFPHVYKPQKQEDMSNIHSFKTNSYTDYKQNYPQTRDLKQLAVTKPTQNNLVPRLKQKTKFVSIQTKNKLSQHKRVSPYLIATPSLTR